MDSDLRLLERFRDHRDPAAFSELVRRYAGCVYGACLRVLRDPSLAEDASQETFFRLMRRPDSVSQSLGGWLHRAATRQAIDARRTEICRRRREEGYADEAARTERTEPRSAWAVVSPLLDESLTALPEGSRDLLVRHYLRGQPQAQIATETGASPATLCRRIKVAVEELRLELRKRGCDVSPSVLGLLCLRHAAVQSPAALLHELGKMALYYAAKSGAAASAAAALRTALRAAARSPGVLAGAGISVVALAALLWIGQQYLDARVPTDRARPATADSAGPGGYPPGLAAYAPKPR